MLKGLGFTLVFDKTKVEKGKEKLQKKKKKKNLLKLAWTVNTSKDVMS